MDEKEELLRRAHELVHPDGRKKRSDAGKQRSAYKPRKNTKTNTKNEWWKYQNACSKFFKPIYNEEVVDDVIYDDYGFYWPRKGKLIYAPQQWTQFDKLGRPHVHNFKKTQETKPFDLERYRFNAYQEKAFETPNEIIPYGKHLGKDGVTAELNNICYYRHKLISLQVKKFFEKTPLTWSDLFRFVYYISKEDLNKPWTYELWREHFKCVPYGELKDDFTFCYKHKPGSPEFHPEWVYKSIKSAQQKIIDEYDEKIERYYRAQKLRDGESDGEGYVRWLDIKNKLEAERDRKLEELKHDINTES